MAIASPESPRIVGRYAMFGRIAAGGMATVQLGRMMGPAGFSRVVAMKRMHPQFAKDPEFVTMFLDEARLAARVRHPNVVSSTDVVAEAGELFIVMEYVEGEALSNLLRLAAAQKRPPPKDVLVAIVVQALHGLHAAHEAKSEAGMPLGIVHRDVSPQNILVGADGLARVVEFGIARAAGRAQHHTQEGVLKGKVSYMAPEQVRSQPLDRRADVYAAGVVLWEALTGARLYKSDTPLETIERVLRAGAAPPSTHDPSISPALDAVISRAIAPTREHRYGTALELADALEQALTPASHRAVGKWVEETARKELAMRARLVSVSEGAEAVADTPAPAPPPPAPFVPAEATDAKPAAAKPALSPIDLAVRSPPELDLDAPTIERTESVPARRLAVAPLPASAPPPIATGAAMDPVPPPPRPGRRTLVLVASLSAIVVFAIGALVLGLTRSSTTGASTLTSSSSSPSFAATAASSSFGSSSPSPPASSPTMPPSSTSSATPTSQPEPSASSMRTAPTFTARPAPTTDRCSPPYYYDENHMKRFKPGCVR